MLGYTLAIAEENRVADGKRLGVKLGRVCIKNSVPVIDVAKKFGVSRQTIYNWFSGRGSPRSTLQAAIEKYIASFSS